jgi:hypothetical protein
MKGRALVFLGLLAIWPQLGGAAPLVRDLGDGLGYVRIHELPADLPAQATKAPTALVVDVRYVTAGPEAVAAFAAWLEFRATPRAPLLVLANRDTAGGLRAVLRGFRRGSGLAVIGLPGPDFEPDLAVRSTVADERAAYTAVENGTPLATVLTDQPNKVRQDEARLVRPLAAEAETESGGEAPRAIPVDAPLQRALHLHRALRALRRL